jgi:predicted membrane protein
MCSGIRKKTRQNWLRMRIGAGTFIACAGSVSGLTCAKLPAFGARFHNAAALLKAALRRSRRIESE